MTTDDAAKPIRTLHDLTEKLGRDADPIRSPAEQQAAARIGDASLAVLGTVGHDGGAQAEYDQDPKLRELLAAAADATTVSRDSAAQRSDDLDWLEEPLSVERPARQVWLLWDSGDLVGTAAYSSEAAAEAARVAYTAKVRAELASEEDPRPARVNIEVFPIDVQD